MEADARSKETEKDTPMKRTLSKVTMDLGFYDRLKSDLDYANERGFQYDALIELLGCSEEAAHDVVRDLISGSKDAEPGRAYEALVYTEFNALQLVNEIVEALGCTVAEVMPRIGALRNVEALTRQRGIDERVGRLVRGMKHDNYLAKNDDGSYRASSNPPSFSGVGWYDGLNAADAMRQAGIEEAG